MDKKPQNRLKSGRPDNLKGHREATQFKPGNCANPGGRPKLPEEIKQMKESTLERAIILFHDKIHNEDWVKNVEDRDFLAYLEAAFDRLGLPKIAKNEHDVGENLAHLLERSWDNQESAGS